MRTDSISDPSATEFSICIPSNRPLAEAKASILSACLVLERAKGEVIVSDNSGEAEKAAWLEELSRQYPGRLHVIGSPHADSFVNWSNAIQGARGRFIGVLSDDDLLHFLGVPCFDQPPDVVAVKPNIVIWDPRRGVARVNAFPLLGATALERVIEYVQKSAGNNTTLYSFLRADVMRSIFALGAHHPTRGSYLDWANVFAWVSSGRYVTDPNILMVYNNHNWSGDAATIERTVQGQYTEVGFPARIVPFRTALSALDAFIMIVRRDSPVGLAERREAATWALRTLSEPLIRQSVANRDAFSDAELRILERLALAVDVDGWLNAILRLLEHFAPDIAERYVCYYARVVGAPWGEFPDAG